MKNTKNFTIFAGVNGAGKSTLFYSEEQVDLGVRLNSDELIHAAGLDWKDMRAQITAGKQLLQMQKECLAKGLSFNQETTLSGATILNAIHKAKELGYQIHLRYVGVENAKIAKERVERRIALGGHGVSGGTIERRFVTSKENFQKVYPLCDTINIYDNSGVAMVLVASLVNGRLERTSVICPWVDELIRSLI